MEGVGAQSAALQTAGHAELHAPAPGAVLASPAFSPACSGQGGHPGACGHSGLSLRRRKPQCPPLSVCRTPPGWEGLGRHPPRSERGVGMEPLPVAVRFPWEKKFFFFKFFFWPCRMACRISVSRAGIEPGPQQRKPRTLTTRPLRKPPFKSLSFDTFPEVLHRFELEKSGRPNSKA